MQKNIKNFKGMSLVEMLVVLVIFAFLGIVVTQTLASSFKSSKKSDSKIVARQNVDFAMSTMERLLRNAIDIDCSSPSGSQLNFTDENSKASYFACSGGRVNFHNPPAADQRLTGSDVTITNCSSFYSMCTEATGTVPDSVTITLTGQSTAVGGVEGSQVTSTSRILLRIYP